MPKEHHLEALNPRTAIRDLAAHYLKLVRAVQPEGPYLMFGYADGGILIFELVRQLLELGQNIAFLGMFDAPRLGPPPPRSLINRMKDHLTVLSRLPRAGQWSYLRPRIRNIFSKLASRIDLPRRPSQAPLGSDNDRLTGPTMGNFAYATTWYRVMRYYQPGRYPGRLTLILGRDSPRFFGLEAGWRELADEGADIILIPGNHCKNLTEPLVGTTARIIAEAIRDLG